MNPCPPPEGGRGWLLPKLLWLEYMLVLVGFGGLVKRTGVAAWVSCEGEAGCYWL